MTFQATGKPFPPQQAADLANAAIAAAGIDPKVIAAATALMDLAAQVKAGNGAETLANICSAILAHARPEAAAVPDLFRKVESYELPSNGCYGNSYIADHPQYGQAQLDFCTPLPEFAPRALESSGATQTGINFSDATRLMRFYAQLPESHQLQIESLKGSAALSQPFCFELQLLARDANLPLKDVMAQNVSVGIRLADGSETYINGYVDVFGFTHADGGFAFYEARIVPWFSFLSMRVNSRIYQDMTVLNVIEQVFAEYKAIATFCFRTNQTYEPECLFVQYNESDAAFVSRLMEEYGLFYYFEHSIDANTMVISDDSCDSTFCPPHATHAEVKFNGGNRAQHEDCVTELSARRQLHASRMTLNTFDFKAPYGQRMIEVDTVSKQGRVPFVEVYDGNPAFAFANRARGERIARMRMELIEWQGKLFQGASDCRGFTAGHTFELQEHHWFEEGAVGDNDFLLTEVRYEAHNNYLARGSASVYRNTFTAIRRKIPYRPRLEHPVPRMPGPQTATVVGPKGGEIHTDQFGRIKVQFHWDRYGKHDENSSPWLRPLQAVAGQGWGMIAIPRVGQEVLIDFLEGNPARPVVTGRLFNAEQPVPYPLPANAHITGFRSRSTPGGGGFSEIAIHDAKNKELLNIRAQRDMVTTVLGCQSTVIYGASQATQVPKGSCTTWAQGSIEMQSRSRHVHITAQTEITLEAGASLLRLNANGIIEYRGVFRPAGSIKSPATKEVADVSQLTTSAPITETGDPVELDIFKRLAKNNALPSETIAERALRNPSVTGPVARDPAAEDYQRLRTANKIKSALLLGSPGGAPGALSALAGQDEHKVAAAHEVGGVMHVMLMGAAGFPVRAPISVAPRTALKTYHPPNHVGGGRPILESYPAKTTIRLKGIDDQVKFLSKNIPGLGTEQAKALLEPAFTRNSSVVIGGSRVRGNSNSKSDLDVGYGNLSTKQAERIVEKHNRDFFEKGKGLKLEDRIIIVPGNSTPNVSKMTSAEEFFQRSGIRSARDPKSGDPYGPSGSVTLYPDGRIQILPPGSQL